VTYSIRVHAEADAEHGQTIAWLTEHVSAHHAIAYATAISRALDEILELPLAWPQWRARADIRVRHLPEISYSIIYQVQDRVVTIAAFAHMHRAPGYWLDRVR
jgi:toxin ParE2